MVNSDVFHAMFSHETTKEARESRIVIEDSTATAVRQMLIYLYTNELPEEFAIETDAGLLMHIANKYQIKSLVQLIERKLVNRFSFANFKIRYSTKLTARHFLLIFLRYLGSEGNLRKEQK
jgi:hypothetical protein